jgi:RecA-family ATPase
MNRMSYDFDDMARDQGGDAIVAALRDAPYAFEPSYPEDQAYQADGDDAPLPGRADLASWKGKSAPHRRFIIPGWIVRGSAGLLSGMEGVGKSLIAQQMATCAGIGRRFLGLEIAHVPAAYISCEDDIDEMWRRQEAINAILGITMDDLAGRLELVSLKGEIGNELGTFDQAGRLSISARYRQILRVCEEAKPGLVFLDNAAHFFAGNENARHDVAAFLGLIEQLSIRIDGAVVLLSHPNKQHSQGNTQGNEYSGSTGWSAHVRNRLFLDYAKSSGEGDFVDDDDRVLRKSKANYGKRGEEITFRWHEWAFVLPEELSSTMSGEIAKAAEAGRMNEVFLACLDAATKSRVPTSASRAASNWAPRVFAKMPTARGASAEALEHALQRLLHLEQIKGDCELWRRPNRSWVVGLGRA